MITRLSKDPGSSSTNGQQRGRLLSTAGPLPASLAELEMEMHRLLEILATQTGKLADGTAVLRQFDLQIAYLSSTIAIISTLNTLDGIQCTFSPKSQLSEATNCQGEGTQLVCDLTLHNGSTTDLSGNWALVIASYPETTRTSYQPELGGYSTHSIALPTIPAGANWIDTLLLPAECAGLVRVFLCLLGGNDETLLCPPMALLHSFRLDCLHSLQATHCAGPMVSSIAPGLHHSIGLTFGVPKSVFGISPDTGKLLQQISVMGNCSLQDVLHPPDHITAAEMFARLKVEHPHVKAGTNHAQSWSLRGAVAASGEVVSASVHASRAVHAGPTAASSSGYDVIDVQCDASHLSGALMLHEAVLHRLDLLHCAVSKSDVPANCIKLPDGKYIVTPSGKAALVDSAALDRAILQIEALAGETAHLRQELVTGRERKALLFDGGDNEAEFDEMKSTFEKLMSRTRELSFSLPIVI